MGKAKPKEKEEAPDAGAPMELDLGAGEAGAPAGDAPPDAANEPAPNPEGGKPSYEQLLAAIEESERRREADGRKLSKMIEVQQAELAELRRKVSGMGRSPVAAKLTMLYHPKLAPEGQTFVEGEEPECSPGGWTGDLKELRKSMQGG